MLPLKAHVAGQNLSLLWLTKEEVTGLQAS